MTFLDDHVSIIPVGFPPRAFAPDVDVDALVESMAAAPAPAKRLIFTEAATEVGRDGRSIDLIWEVSTADDGTRELAVLSVFHTSRKTFSASLVAQHEEPGGPGFRPIRSHMPFDAIRIASLPCPRFSAKAMATATTAALIALANQADKPSVKAVFGEQ